MLRKGLLYLMVVSGLLLFAACTNDIESDEVDHNSYESSMEADLQASVEEQGRGGLGGATADSAKDSSDADDFVEQQIDTLDAQTNMADSNTDLEEGEVRAGTEDSADLAEGEDLAGVADSNAELAEGEDLTTVADSNADRAGSEERTEWLPEVFQQYVSNSIPMDDDESVVAFVIGDIDLDGYEEAVVGIGNLSSDFRKVYLLKNQEGSVTSIQDNIVETIYWVYELKLVELEDRPNPVIYLGVSNGGPMGGFQLVEYINGELNTLAYSASATGSGWDRLIDSNGDGRYDGYVQERWSYDVLYYGTYRYFKLEQGAFVLDRVDVDLPAYPDDPEGVVAEYVSLTMLNEPESSEVAERLADLCPSCSDSLHSLLLNSTYWNPFIKEDLQVIMGEDDQTAQVSLALNEEAGSGEALRFQLYLEESRWKIESYEMVEETVE